MAKIAPDWSFETTYGLYQGKCVVGVDEVGRGPLAGPVIAAAAFGDPALIEDRLGGLLNDSKKLTEKKRLVIANEAGDIAEICLGRAEVDEIDRINILQASLLAMRRAINGLAQQIGRDLDMVLVDGNRLPDINYPATAIVKGDGRSKLIALASVMAKVARDKEMSGLADQFPGYGWERNAGYGTAEHMTALKSKGATPHHRCSFAPVRSVLEK